MDPLVIPLASITNDGFGVDVVVPGASLRPDALVQPALGDVRVAGRLKAIDSEEFLFRGTVSGVYTGPCDRCLERSEAPFTLDVAWFFEHSAAPDSLDDLDAYEVNETTADDDRKRTFAGEAIALKEHVWEEIVLTAPTKFLCKPDCKGLCPVCGVNWNAGACQCRAPDATSNTGFAALADMFPNLGKSED